MARAPRPRDQGLRPDDRLFRGADRWFYLAAPTPEEAALIPSVAGLEDMDAADPQLESKLVAAFTTDTAESWVGRLRDAGLSAAIALQLEEVMEEDWTKESGLSIWRDHPGVGSVRSPGPAPRLSLTPARILSPAPLPGWDAQAVLDAAGIGDRYAELVASGIILPEMPGGAAAVV